MKVLNLYAGIGGNRKLWEDVEVTAVEYKPEIAAIYQDFFPQDKMVIGDAHQYLIDHYQDFDFIWASPPCPTHSRMNFLGNVQEGKKINYPDMKLYEEIILLKTWFEGKWCVENVISYYDPLITPIKSDSHYFWSNFAFRTEKNKKRGIANRSKEDWEGQWLEKQLGFDTSKYNLNKRFRRDIINNCVRPETGLHILNCARNIITKQNTEQLDIFDA